MVSPEARGKGHDWHSPITRLEYRQTRFLFSTDKGAEGESEGRGHQFWRDKIIGFCCKIQNVLPGACPIVDAQ